MHAQPIGLTVERFGCGDRFLVLANSNHHFIGITLQLGLVACGCLFLNLHRGQRAKCHVRA
jgi:hypothetical protein